MKITFPLALLLLFVALKLTGHISWSWWWVTSPLWLGFAVAFVFYVVAVFALALRNARRR